MLSKGPAAVTADSGSKSMPLLWTIILPLVTGIFVGSLLSSSFILVDTPSLEDENNPGLIDEGELTEGLSSAALGGSDGLGSGGEGEEERESKGKLDLISWVAAEEDPSDYFSKDLDLLAEVPPDSPIITALQRSTTSLSSHVDQLKQQQRGGGIINSLLATALKDLEKDIQEASEKVTVIDAVTAVELFRTPPELREEFKKKMRRDVMSVGEIRRQREKAGQGRSGKEAVGECMELYVKGEEEERVHKIAWQIELQELREQSYRNLVLQQILYMESKRTWWESFNFGSYKEAKEHLMAMQPNDANHDQLLDFLIWYFLYKDWYDGGDAPHYVKLKEFVQEQNERVLIVSEERKAKEIQLKLTMAEMWQKCGVILKHWNWTEEQDAVLDFYDELEGIHGGNSHCIDWDTVDENLPKKPDRRLPAYTWQKDPDYYPDPHLNFSFLLQYAGSEEAIEPLVDRLHECTNGALGTGKMRGVLSEMYVYVFEPEKTLKKWIEMWNKTDESLFVVPILPHNVTVAEGFNEMARLARGDILVFLQDEDLPPEGCDWLRSLLRAFEEWPRLGIAGYHVDEMELKTTASEVVNSWHKFSQSEEQLNLFDPQSQVKMHFTGSVNLAPLVARRKAFLRMGGFDEADLREGEAGVVADWLLCSRMWLSGYQVAKLEIEDGDFRQNSRQKQKPVPHVVRRTKVADFGDLDKVYVDKYKVIQKEIKRLNGILRAT